MQRPKTPAPFDRARAFREITGRSPIDRRSRDASRDDAAMALEDAAREARAAYEVARRTGASRGRSSVDASWWEKREAQKRAVVDAFVRRSVDDDSFWRAVDDAMGDDAG